MEAPSPTMDTAQLSLQNAHYFFSQHANTDLEPGRFFQVFHSVFLFPVFSASSRHPAEAQANRRPDEGERESRSASVCSLQPHTWQEAACNFVAYTSIRPCCTQHWTLSAHGTGLASPPPVIPLLVVDSLGLGCSDTSVLSGLGAVQMGLSPGGNAAGTWAPPKKQSPPGASFPIYRFSPQLAQHSHTHPVANGLFPAGRTSCPRAKSQQKSDPRIQMLGLMQMWLDDAVFPQFFCLPLPPCPSPTGLT